MAIRKGYKQTEFGIIPEDWIICQFQDVLTTFSSGATPYRGIADYYKGHIRWISSGELNYNIINETIEHISELAARNTNLKTHKPGTFLMAITGLETEGTRGRCALIGADSTTNQSCMAINGTNKMDVNYLFWFYKSWGNYLAFKYCQGTKQQSYTAAIVKTLPICCPPTLAEQTAIATALSDMDALITALDKKIAKKKLIKQGAMQQLLTGKKRMPGFSGKWMEKKLGEVVEIYRGGSPRPIENYLTQNIDGINWIKIGDVGISAKYIHATEEKIRKEGVPYSRVVKEGDFLLSNSMSFGRPYILKTSGCIHDGWLVIQNYADTFDIDFLYYILGYNTTFNQYKSLAAGSSVLNLNKAIVSKITIGIPPKAEQTAISQILSDMDNEIAALETKRDKYKQLKNGMMQELLTGKICLVESVNKSQKEEVIELKPEKKSHNDQINEAVVISFLVHKFGTKDYPLSRFRYTKYAYLLHRQYEHEAKGFHKHVAGPYKPTNRYKGPESIAIKNKYIDKVGNPKSGKDAFIANKDIEKALVYFTEWYGTDIQQWIEQFRYYKNDYLEVLATVDESICDLEKQGKQISVNNIKEYIRSIPQWKAKLDKPYFSDFNIQKAINESYKLFGEY